MKYFQQKHIENKTIFIFLKKRERESIIKRKNEERKFMFVQEKRNSLKDRVKTQSDVAMTQLY